MLTVPSVAESQRAVRVPTGVPTLDTLLHGGRSTGSTTVLLGPRGSDKTSVGLAFLATGTRVVEPGHHLGFYERPQHLLRKANQIGIKLQ